MNVQVKIVGMVLSLSVSIGSLSGADLRGKIDTIIRSQKNVEFSVHVLKAQTGETLYAYRADQAMIPASNMKLVTTAAALRTLGPDFVYVTRVGLIGQTLVVLGSGDPLLGDAEHRGQAWPFTGVDLSGHCGSYSPGRCVADHRHRRRYDRIRRPAGPSPLAHR